MISTASELSIPNLITDYILEKCLQVHWPDRYVSLFGASYYDESNERDDVPFEEQLRGLEAVIKAGKVKLNIPLSDCNTQDTQKQSKY